jgi:hypothetical protein
MKYHWVLRSFRINTTGEMNLARDALPSGGNLGAPCTSSHEDAISERHFGTASYGKCLTKRVQNRFASVARYHDRQPRGERYKGPSRSCSHEQLSEAADNHRYPVRCRSKLAGSGRNMSLETLLYHLLGPAGQKKGNADSMGARLRLAVAILPRTRRNCPMIQPPKCSTTCSIPR